MHKITLTTSQALLKFLDNQYIVIDDEENKFINNVFGVFGHGSVLGIGQALNQKNHNLKFIQGKNEQNMALAAVAFAKQKNRKEIIPCISSIGPGALNMVTAAGCATANRIPLLLLPGDTFADRQPDPVLQQVEIFDNYTTTATDAFKPVCHYWDRIVRPEQLMISALHAMRVLTDPADTGAVCLAIPQDVASQAYEYPLEFFKKRKWHLERRLPTKNQIKRVYKILRAAKKPLIIVGGGVRYSEAESVLKKFSEITNIPFSETQAGKGILPWDHPMNLGGIGVTGGKAANIIAKEADTIIAVGTRLTDFTTCSKWLFKKDANIISINICSFDALKMDSESIICDAKEMLDALIRNINGYRSSYTNEIKDAKNEWDKIVESYYEKKDPGRLSQTRALGIINQHMPDNAVAVGASGSLPGDMQRLFKTKDKYGYHVEYGFSTMGYETNGALGVKLACPEKEVYSFFGDGVYLMAHSEILTALQEGLRIHFCLFDNAGWGCIENLQTAQGDDTFGTVFSKRNSATKELDGEIIAVDYAQNAASYGLKTYRISTEEELIFALKDALKQPLPVLYDIKVKPKSMTSDYSSWWRVGVAEISDDIKIQEASFEMKKQLEKSRKY